MNVCKLVFLGITCWLTVPVASAFDFKGIKLGSTATVEQVKEKLGVQCGAGARGMTICNGRVTVGREPGDMNLVINDQGIVQRIAITLKPYSFDALEPLLIEKFGPPQKTTRSQVQNRMGAKFDDVSHLWEENDGDNQLLFWKYAGSIDSSVLNFRTKADRDLLGARTANRKGDL